MDEELNSEQHLKLIRRNQKLSWGFAVLAILLAGLVFYVRKQRTEMPRELVGVWKTEDPKYADRFFEIGLVSISFGTGGATEYTGFIRRVDSVSDNGEVWYTIEYTVNDQQNTLIFSYAPAAGNTIRFRNQDKIVWSKQKSP
jgi:hypothetical protein